MKILITGSSGFIGNKIFAEMDCCAKGLVPYDIKGGDDIRDLLKLDRLFEVEQFDTVIHCAALTGVRRSEFYPEEYISTNIIGTLNLISLSEKYGIKHFINFSSSSVYGQKDNSQITEDHEKNPTSIYGMTKLIAEQIVNRSKIITTIIRPFTVYGEFGRPDQVIQKWINQIKKDKPITFYGDGNTGRGYTYIEDLVKGVKTIIKKEAINKHQTYNLGGTQFILLSELLEIFKEVVPNLKVDYRDLLSGDNLYSYASITKAEVEFNWKPKTDFKKTLKKIIKGQL